MKLLYIYITLFSVMSFSFADVINVPADQSTIQAGINAAIDGDTVLVAENTYYENINFKGKKITVASRFILDQDTSHISKTIINGSQPSDPDSGSVVYFVSGEDTTSVLCGFTITGGSGTEYISDGSLGRAGGGIFSFYSGPRISSNKIEKNNVYRATGHTYGGGIFSGPIGSDTHIIVEDNIVRFNSVEAMDIYAYGGGMRISSNGKILRNQILNNEAKSSAGNYTSNGGGISCKNENTKPYKLILIKDNLIANNQSKSISYWAKSGGVSLLYTNFIFDNNIISNNISNGVSGGNAAGLHIFYSDSVSVIINNLFSSNNGGGMQVEFTEGIRLENNRFENNESNSPGGGIRLFSCNLTNIIGNEFTGNIAVAGGGLYMEQSNNLVVQGNRFKSNESGYGGGINEDNCTNTQIIQNDIIGNIATVWGGGIQNFSSVNTLISNNNILRNSAPSGAGVLVDEQHAVILKNLIAGNTADSLGGGIIIFYEDQNSSSGKTFRSTIKYPDEGKIVGSEQIQQTQDNLIYTQKAASGDKTILINNTIADNKAHTGGGIYHESDSTIIRNTILWGNTALVGKEIYNERGTMDVMYSDIQDTVWAGIGNIKADPWFYDDTLYHLGTGSPCIDTGDPSPTCNDSDGTRNDMGRYGGISDSLIACPTGLFGMESFVGKNPAYFELSQNYPNPFNPTTNIEFQIPSSQFITLKVFNILGQQVATLVSEKLKPGNYSYVWDASGFASGVYFYRFAIDNGLTLSKKLVLLK